MREKGPHVISLRMGRMESVSPSSTLGELFFFPIVMHDLLDSYTPVKGLDMWLHEC